MDCLRHTGKRGRRRQDERRGLDGEMRNIVESVQVMYKDGSILDLDNETTGGSVTATA